jgi:hypothetical protein
MTEPDGHGSATPDAEASLIAEEFEVGEASYESAADGLAPDEAFQTLASEVRVSVLVHLLTAERAGEEPLAFSDLQDAADSDSSAGFAYHLRQLSGHFVRRVEDGYVLTPPGRRAAEAVVSGTFTDPRETNRAS